MDGRSGLPGVFIASPFFNPAQVAIVQRIEETLADRGYPFYSARLHSGSMNFTPEQRKDPKCWDLIFDSNERGFIEMDICVAILEWALLEGQSMRVCEPGGGYWPLRAVTDPIEVPDSGTVFEVGAFRYLGKPVVGFHSRKQPKDINLMLAKGCDGILCGWPALDKFFNPGGEQFIPRETPAVSLLSKRANLDWTEQFFTWSALSSFTGEII